MKIYAHRGFSGKFPEGSLTAYQGAIDIKADGMECDIRLSKDGKLLCFHDATTDRLTGKPGRVSKLTYSEINSRVPTLLFEELLQLAIENRMDLLVETKHPVRSGSRVESQVIDLLLENEKKIVASGIRVVIMSFSFLAVLRAKRRYPNVGYVVKSAWRLNFLPSNIVAIGFFLVKKNQRLIEKLRDREVLVWTLNEREDLEYARELGLQNIITNFPDRAQEVFKR